jgi:hypothetical protein
VAALTIAGLPHAAAGQVPPAWFGEWTLNIARSTYSPGPPPYKRATYTITPWNDGMKVIYEMVHPRGGVTHLEWIGKLDGKDYPLQGMDEVVTYAYKPISDGAYEVVVKIGGRAATSIVRLSPDGRSMTTTTKGVDGSGRVVSTTTVYEKE